MLSEQYPSGRVVTTSYDGAHRPSTLSGTLAGAQKTYVSSAGYSPQGAQSYVIYGNNVVSSYSYNSRLQPSGLSAQIGTGGSFYLASNT